MTHAPSIENNGRSANKILVGKPEENRSLEGPSCRWEDNIGMDIREQDGEGAG
jgi:hypothetical protein